MNAALVDAPKDARSTSIWALLACIIIVIAATGTIHPLTDPDVWWQVRTGQLIFDSRSVPTNEPWAFSALGDPWVPNAWLSDLGFGLTQQLLGWTGIIALATVLASLLLVLVFLLAWRSGPPPAAAVIVCLVVLQLAPFLTARPQLVSFIFCTWLAPASLDAAQGKAPRWWMAALVTYAWINLHGMWVLVPMMFCLAGIGYLLDKGVWTRHSLKLFLFAGCCFVLAALTPAGPRLAYWWLEVWNRASGVTEWQPTILGSTANAALFCLFTITFVSWALTARRPRRSEVLWVLGLLGFSLVAARNVAPVAILLIPVAVPAVAPLVGGIRTRSVSVWAIAGTVVVGLMVAGLALSLVQPTPTNAPSAIVDELLQREGPVRVVNDFNIGGYLTGVGAPTISVAVDGRIDVFQPEFTEDYFAMLGGESGWDTTFTQLDPDVAVLSASNALRQLLLADGWEETLVDGQYALLEPTQYTITQ